ncbi:MAG: Na/Pi cotransporter family protein [Clostridia bacterium]|nr:Na/Pi cotransporter family protein [Clostridia bacterium]
MGYQEILALVGGIALFLFGMTVMGDALERSAGRQMKNILGKFTSNPVKGFILGMTVTAIIQSSSATTVMLVGFVNSGLMTLTSAIPVIMGANVGTTITAWILSLSGLEGDSFIVQIFKPSTFTPILAAIGVILFVFIKNARKKDIGLALLGFAVLIFGMDAMSDAVSGLKNVPEFTNLFTKFKNPILGVLVGALVTAIIQSSSASVGILQALAATGQIPFISAIPIIMGQNIGTCVTAMISSVGANKNAKRVAMVHLYFNIISTVVLLAAFSVCDHVFDIEAMLPPYIDEVGIAIVHSAFNITATLILLPFGRLLGKLATITVRDKSGTAEKTALFDERLLATPAVAIDRTKAVAFEMADLSLSSVKRSIGMLDAYSDSDMEYVTKDEDRADVLEDEIGSYLLKISGRELSAEDNLEVTKLLHMIGDLERLSDHAVNLAESSREMYEKNVAFSDSAKRELDVMTDAVGEIIDIALRSFKENDVELAKTVEPLETVIDDLQSDIRLNHIARLKRNECTVELGFILSDLLTNLERIADHCSNIAGCVIEIDRSSLGMHGYTRDVKGGSAAYDELYEKYSEKYSLLPKLV